MTKVVKKADVFKPVLAKQTVEVPSLGGSVVVTGLTLSARLKLFANHTQASVAQMLAMTVQDADGQPLFTEEEWDNFGVKNFNATIELFKVAKQLSGLDAEVEVKNS